jgi:hypothetical protein
MWHRWCVAGLLKAEERFRRVKGRNELPALLRSLDRHDVMESNADWRVLLTLPGFSTTGGTASFIPL